jgi:protein-S-isoprenylcysteine O-methyltransferase Ste14
VAEPSIAMQLLARFRVALGWVFAPLVFIAADPTAVSIAIGAAVAAVGEALRFWAAGHLNKAREVTSSGPYRWVAHPLYVGSSVMGAGLAVASGSPIAAFLIALYLSVTLRAAIRSEEAFLRRMFGAEYDRYRARTRTPNGDGVAATRRTFSVARAIDNREHRAVAGLVGALLLLALKATYNGSFWRAAAGP